MHPAVRYLEEQYDLLIRYPHLRAGYGVNGLYSIKDDTCEYCNEDEDFAHCVGMLRNMYYRHIPIPDDELIPDMHKFPCP